MKSAGHVAYDAFRKEVPWLLAWEKLTDEMQAKWEGLADETMTIGHQAKPA